jgi:hypothetical protein
MSRFSDIALSLTERGFRVFPLVPNQKFPFKMAGDADHFDAATTDEGQIREWDAQAPTANVGLSPDEIFCFLETDDEAALKDACAGLPSEVWDTTRVSARDNRCYYIFRQTMRTKRAGNMTATREGKDNLFEFKQHRVYVTGPESIHPKTKAPYAVEWRIIPAMPDVLLNRLCDLYGAPRATNSGVMSAEVRRETELLDSFLLRYDVAISGEWFNKGKQWYRPIECPWKDAHANTNAGTSTCIVYTERKGYGFDCKHRCAGKGWKDFRAELERLHPRRGFSFAGDAGPDVIIVQATGKRTKGEPVKEWRSRYMTEETFLNVKPPEFLIEGFLVKGSIAMLAGPVAQRKSIIALNMAHALCTREPLFKYFDVTGGHERVVYLCPEMGAASFVKRIKQIGLSEYVGRTLFVQTMSEDSTALDELDGELPGAVIIVDTITRFIEGNENESKDMREFARKVFRLVNAGATVVLLHHSKKGSSGSLDDGVRGSSELGAFVDSCWVTELEDPKKPYESLSKMRNVKQRDFESDPFKLKPAPGSYYLAIDSEPGPEAVLNDRANDAALDALKKLLASDPKIGINRLQKALKALGHRKGGDWVTKERARLTGAGVTLTE